jgi:hypothetical protein
LDEHGAAPDGVGEGGVDGDGGLALRAVKLNRPYDSRGDLGVAVPDCKFVDILTKDAKAIGDVLGKVAQAYQVADQAAAGRLTTDPGKPVVDG